MFQSVKDGASTATASTNLLGGFGNMASVSHPKPTKQLLLLVTIKAIIPTNSQQHLHLQRSSIHPSFVFCHKTLTYTVITDKDKTPVIL